jgi:hypothetical protein
VVLCGCGNEVTLEVVIAQSGITSKMLRKDAPGLKVRVVNVLDLMSLYLSRYPPPVLLFISVILIIMDMDRFSRPTDPWCSPSTAVRLSSFSSGAPAPPACTWYSLPLFTLLQSSIEPNTCLC